MEWSTTSALLADLRDFSNAEAWGGFVDRVLPILVAHTRKSGMQDADAEDLAQAALMRFASAYQEGRYERAKGGLRSWLFTITHRLMVDHFRSRGTLAARRTVSCDADSEDRGLDIEDPSAAARFEEAWDREVLARCLQRVRMEFSYAPYRAFLLTSLHGLPAAQVAEELGISRRSVYLSKYRVLRRMSELQAAFESLD